MSQNIKGTAPREGGPHNDVLLAGSDITNSEICFQKQASRAVSLIAQRFGLSVPVAVVVAELAGFDGARA